MGLTLLASRVRVLDHGRVTVPHFEVCGTVDHFWVCTGRGLPRAVGIDLDPAGEYGPRGENVLVQYHAMRLARAGMPGESSLSPAPGEFS